jgi:lysozyme family protein
MGDFADFFKDLKKHEGYYAFVKGDKGGETYMGVARVSHPKWGGWDTIDKLKKELKVKKLPYKKEVPALEKDVKDFYKENYWDKIHGDKIENDSVANILVDFKVNGGFNSKNIKQIQTEVGVKADGKWGPATVDAINKHKNPEELHKAIFDIRKNHYEAQSKKEGQEKFHDGWMNRLNDHKYKEQSEKGRQDNIGTPGDAGSSFIILGFEDSIQDILASIQRLENNLQ